MQFRDTASFGKRIESFIIGEMSMKGSDVRTPVIDDHSADCAVKKEDGTFVEIQIKVKSKGTKQSGHFSVDNHRDAHENFFFIFYGEIADTLWAFHSEISLKNLESIKSAKTQEVIVSLY